MTQTTPIATKAYTKALTAVRAWLTTLDQPYQENIEEPYKLSVDFVVVGQIPFAVDVLAPNELYDNYEQQKRFLLAKRIALAERFGPYLPFVVVLPETSKDAVVPFADCVLNAKRLPKKLDKLDISFNRTVLNILKEGVPPLSNLLASGQWLEQWCADTSLHELQTHQDFSEGCVAHTLKHSFANAKVKSIESSMPLISNQVQEMITEHLGGHILPAKQIADDAKPFQHSTLEFVGWRTRNGSQVLLSIFCISLFGDVPAIDEEDDPFTINDPQETVYHALIGDAWQIRARSDMEFDALVMLLGCEQKKQIRGLVKTVQKPSIPLEIINSLESAGWIVCPWDFAEETPQFIEILKKETNKRKKR